MDAEDKKSVGVENKPGTLSDISSISTGEVEQYLSKLYSKTEELEPPEYQIDPEILTRFRLDRTNETGFSLAIPSEPGAKNREQAKTDAPQKEIKGLLYPFPAATNPRLSKILASYRLQDSSTPSTAPLSVKMKGVDINPWAEEVLEKIGRNWLIHPFQYQEGKGVVGISLTIAESGEFIAVEVVKSSGNTSLDQSALNAIKMSNPLPGLPDAFPRTQLVIYIEFEYDD